MKKKKDLKISTASSKFMLPISVPLVKVRESKATTTRRNRITTSEKDDAYWHIENGIEPFELGSTGSISVQDAIKLCQQAYWNFSIFRNTIDVMSEFSSCEMFLRGGSKKSQDFFYKWFDIINLMDLQDKFFREFYRSGNTFLIRFERKIKDEDLIKINQVFGATTKDSTLPIKYIIINPYDVVVNGNISFASATYSKKLNQYEIRRLKKPQTDDDRNFLESLPKEIREKINKGSGFSEIEVPLDVDKTYAIFYKKQDYEPLAVPMGYPVLKDINWKAEMRAVDMAVTRTMQQIILHVKMGYESKNGEYMFDQKAADAMRELFANESVGKVLVTDFTATAQFVVPEIANFLDPKKYEAVNEDIRMGLNNILVGKNEKFANQHIQVELFIQRLQQGRTIFIQNFLLPEIKRVASSLGFKNYPTPYFEDIDLKDEAEWNRIVTQMTQMGILTPWEAFQSMESGRIPTKEESIESQEEFVKLREKGFYEPLTGGPITQVEVADMANKNAVNMQKTQLDHDSKQKDKQRKHEAENPPPAPPPAIHVNAPTSVKKQEGRPPGSKRKQSTKKISPIGASELYSLSKIKDNLILAMELNKNIASELCKKHKIEELNEEQKSVANDISEIIVANERPRDWNKSIKDYINNPQDKNVDRINEIELLAAEHNVSQYLASILYASTNEDEN